MTTLILTRTIPILRMFDIAKAEAFYGDFLGFSVDWDHRFEPGFPLYRQISRDALVLHLTEHHGDAAPGASVLFMITGLEAFHREISAKDYAYAKPGLDDWIGGGRCVTVTDPFFNRVTFAEPEASPSSTSAA